MASDVAGQDLGGEKPHEYAGEDCTQGSPEEVTEYESKEPEDQHRSDNTKGETLPPTQTRAQRRWSRSGAG